MAIPCYAYIKLKMSGPNEIMMVSGTPKTLGQKVANLELAKAELASTGLKDNMTGTTPENIAPPRKLGQISPPGLDNKLGPMAPEELSKLTTKVTC